MKRLTSPRALAALCLGLLLTTSALCQAEEPSAQDRERARGLLDQGDRHRSTGETEAALKAYAAAHEIMGVPTTGIEVGREQRKLGLLLEARDTWIQVSRYPKRPDEPQPFTEARDEAIRLAVEIAELIPTIEIEHEAQGAQDVKLYLDGTELALEATDVPIRVNPGKHEVRLCARDYECGAVSIVVEEAKHEKLTAKLGAPVPGPEEESAEPHPAPVAAVTPETSPEKRTFVWIGYGVGLAGIATGSVTGILAFSRANQAKEVCDGSSCPQAAEDDIRASKTLGTVSTIGFIVGAAGVTVGTWALLSSKKDSDSSPSPSSNTEVGLLSTPGGATLAFRGTFR